MTTATRASAIIHRGRTRQAVHIMFVCTGNICRSPTAERLTRAYAESYVDVPSMLTAASAGTRAVIGAAMEPTAAAVLSGLGGSADDFTARQLDPDDTRDAGLILTMTRQHRHVVLNTSPRALQHTFTLREAAYLLGSVDLDRLQAPLDPDVRACQIIAELSRRRATRQRLSDESDDIIDPIGRGEEAFLRVGDDIAEALIPILAGLFPAVRSTSDAGPEAQPE